MIFYVGMLKPVFLQISVFTNLHKNILLYKANNVMYKAL